MHCLWWSPSPHLARQRSVALTPRDTGSEFHMTDPRRWGHTASRSGRKPAPLLRSRRQATHVAVGNTMKPWWVTRIAAAAALLVSTLLGCSSEPAPSAANAGSGGNSALAGAGAQPLGGGAGAAASGGTPSVSGSASGGASSGAGGTSSSAGANGTSGMSGMSGMSGSGGVPASAGAGGNGGAGGACLSASCLPPAVVTYPTLPDAV